MKLFNFFYRLAVLVLLTFGCVQLCFLVHKADDFATTRDIESSVSSICGGSGYSNVSLSDLQKAILSFGSAERTLRDMESSLSSISSTAVGIDGHSKEISSALKNFASRLDILPDIESGISKISSNMPGNEVSNCEHLLDCTFDLLEEKFFPNRYKKRIEEAEKSEAREDMFTD